MLDNNAKVIPNNKSRNFGIDALKIVSMLLIITLHIMGRGGILKAAESTNYWIVRFFEIAAYGSVNAYALISGYVGVYSKYRLSNLAALWCRVAFYTVSITLIWKLIYPHEIGTNDLLSSFFPIFSNHYWYFTSYALLFLFIPILNEGLNRLSKKRLGVLLSAIVIATSVFHPVIKHFVGDIFCLGGGYSVWWMMILYLIGGYIRKYGLFQKIKAHRAIIFLGLYFAFVSATWLYKLCMQIVSNRIWGEIRYDDLFINYQSITVLGSAVCLLLAFEHINFGSALTKVIAFLSPMTFSVFLIHCQILIKEKIMTGRFGWIAGLPAYQMIPLIIGVVIGIYLACSFIDLIRFYLFKLLKVKERLNALELNIKEKLSTK